MIGKPKILLTKKGFDLRKKTNILKARLFEIAKDIGLSDEFFFTNATILGNAIGYGYQLVLARLLGVEAFGVFVTLLGIFYVANLVGTSIRNGLAPTIADINTNYGRQMATSAFVKSLKLWMIILITFTCILIALSPLISELLGGIPLPALIVAQISVFGTITFALMLGVTQGLGQFRRLAIVGHMMPQIIKFLLGIILVAVGYKTAGALGGLVVGEVIAAFILIWSSKYIFTQKEHIPQSISNSIFKGYWSGLILVPYLGTFTNVDVWVVASKFNPTDLGLYSAASTLGKTLIFIGIMISLMIGTKLAEQHITKRRIIIITTKAFSLLAILSIPILGAIVIAPHLTVEILFGSDFIMSIDILRTYSVTMMLVSLNIATSLVALKKIRMLALGTIFIIATIATMATTGYSLEGTVNIALLFNSFLFLYLGYGLVNTVRSR